MGRQRPGLGLRPPSRSPRSTAARTAWELVDANVPFAVDAATGDLAVVGELTEGPLRLPGQGDRRRRPVGRPAGHGRSRRRLRLLEPRRGDAGRHGPRPRLLAAGSTRPFGEEPTFRLQDDHGGRYSISTWTGEITLRQPLPLPLRRGRRPDRLDRRRPRRELRRRRSRFQARGEVHDRRPRPVGGDETSRSRGTGIRTTFRKPASTRC